MMRGDSLAGSLAFAAVAGLGSIPWSMMAAPFIGQLWAVALYGLLAVVLYAVVIAPSGPPRLAAGALAALLAAVVGLAAAWPAEVILAAAAILAMVRSGLLYRGKALRTLLLEAGLTVGALLAARFVAGPTPLATGLAIWSFFLVQSLFFLLGGVTARTSDDPPVDPFEHARKRALAIMEEP